jgi:predicted TIM-barrel fold metal-dependent hydrolase
MDYPTLVLDGHIHVMKPNADPAGLLAGMSAAGIRGGTVISFPPPSFRRSDGLPDAEARLDNLLAWTEGHPELFPFFWIDPTEDGALEQAAAAVARGVRGFKVICDRYYPRDPRAMELYRAAAAAGRPVMFHSGILWDGKDSSRYNRPAEFECLLDVEGLSFSLAHVSWPWTDECIAVFGKFHNALTTWNRGSGSRGPVEMFIDLTPGTPPIYRSEVLTRLLTVGYPVGSRIFFGTDNTAAAYDVKWAREWILRDTAALRLLGQSSAEAAAVFGGNLERFVRGHAPGGAA